MKLTLICSSCKHKNQVKKSVNDRSELARKLGKDFQIQCQACAISNSYHINEVIAEQSRWIAISAFIIFFFGTGIVFFLLKDYLLISSNTLTLGGIIAIPSIVYAIIVKQERDNVSRFNSYRV